MPRKSAKRSILLVPILLAGCGGSGNSSPASFRSLTSKFPSPGAIAVSADGSTITGIGYYNPLSINTTGTAWQAGVEFSPWTASETTFRSGIAVNADGTVIVGTGLAPVSGLSTGIVAYRWDPVNGGVVIPMPESTVSAWANGVDGSGDIVVGTEYSATDSKSKGFRYDHGAVTILPTLGTEPYWFANAVSADGTTTVGLAGAHAVKWIGTDAPTSLSSDAQEASALDTSREGSTTVGYAATSVGGLRFACRWTATGYESLGTLPGRTQSVAIAVSDDGNVIVGNAYNVDSDPTTKEPFIWTPNDGLRPLREILTGGRYAAYQKLTYIEVKDISKDGRTIVGVAYDQPTDHYSSFSVRLPASATLGD